MVKSKRVLCISIMGLLLILSNTLQASAKTFIKVGLESLYKDKDTIDLEGGRDLGIGYTEEGIFYLIQWLDESEVHITSGSTTYYKQDQNYKTLEEAKANATSSEVVAYEGPFKFALYTTQPGQYTSSVSEEEVIEIYDTYGRLIFISANIEEPLAFQGDNAEYAFPTTKVGKERVYRGAIEIAVNEGRLTPVNVVLMEEYLYGVVPVEMSASWPEEALKAQAVASRSLATVQYNKYIKRGYNVSDTTSVQVYKGVTLEHVNTNQAVDATRKEVAMYEDKVAETVYFSTSGGYTENSEDVWGSEIPYLRAVEDIYETKPSLAPWTTTITLQDLEKALASANVSIGSASGVRVVSRTATGRVAELEIIATRGSHILTRERIRTFFSGTSIGSLKSRMFQFTPYDDVTIIQDNMTQNTNEGVTSQVRIMSKNDFSQKSLVGLQVVSKAGTKKIEESIFIQGKSDMHYQEIAQGVNQEMISQKDLDGIIHVNETVYGDFTVYGKGYGHGVGMSQSGARGMAEAGYTYDQILMYYFPGIYVSR